jgi:hypothetical protein
MIEPREEARGLAVRRTWQQLDQRSDFYRDGGNLGS